MERIKNREDGGLTVFPVFLLIFKAFDFYISVIIVGNQVYIITDISTAIGFKSFNIQFKIICNIYFIIFYFKGFAPDCKLWFSS